VNEWRKVNKGRSGRSECRCWAIADTCGRCGCCRLLLPLLTLNRHPTATWPDCVVSAGAKITVKGVPCLLPSQTPHVQCAGPGPHARRLSTDLTLMATSPHPRRLSVILVGQSAGDGYSEDAQRLPSGRRFPLPGWLCLGQGPGPHGPRRSESWQG
jgi:hypothetical protein